MKRPQSSVYHFRRRIPRDVLDKVRGTTIRIAVGDQMIERKVGPKAAEIGFSLGTRDPAEAKEREAAALAHLDRAWQALRTGPKRLTKREIVALAGEIYRDWMEALGDDPGSSERWDEINAVNELAMQGESYPGFMMITPESKRRASLNSRFGPFADAVLQRYGLVIDEDSREQLVEEVAKAMIQTSEQLQRHASGDFRPDPDADRFPSMPEPQVIPIKERSDPVPFDVLIEGRWKEAQAGGASRRTLSAWQTAFKHFAAFLGHDDASKVSRSDVVGFKDHRIAEGVSLKTVKDSDLAALKSVMGWGRANGHLAANSAEGVTVKLGRSAHKDKGRSKSFTDDEAAAILAYAAAYQSTSGREQPKTVAAKRWVPWLAAFTGARVGEVAQLRKQDVFEQAGRWVIRITPEAGAVKTGQTRIVPLHRQLIALGFPAFVRQAPNGHLFCTPKDPADPAGALLGLANRLRTAFEGVTPDSEVQPFHAWRHRFTTKARELGCDDSVVRAIVGHSARDVHDRYGDHTIISMARVIDAFPDIDFAEVAGRRGHGVDG